MGKGSEVRHVRKFDGGRSTPQEYHRRWGIRMRCDFCGDPAAIRIRAFIPLVDFMERNPELAAAIMGTNPDGRTIPTVDTIYGKMVKAEEFGACDRCKAAAEKGAAKRYGDSVIVEIDRGPGTKVVAPVPGEVASDA